MDVFILKLFSERVSPKEKRAGAAVFARKLKNWMKIDIELGRKKLNGTWRRKKLNGTSMTHIIGLQWLFTFRCHFNTLYFCALRKKISI